VLNIGFVGIGHLGLVSLVVAAQKNNKIISYGERKEVNAAILGNFNIEEPRLNYFFKKNKKIIHFTHNIKDLQNCDLVYIAKDVCTNSSGKSSLLYLSKILKSVYEFKKKPILIIMSQLPLGYTSKIKWPKKKLFYQVETLVFGRAINRALKPERIILGCDNPKLNIPIKLNKFLHTFQCPIIKMNYQSAELTKISINIFLMSSVITTNTLSEISKKVNANWTDIVSALQLDKRIGKHAYLKPGLGISGGNLERDLFSIAKVSKKLNLDNSLFCIWKKKSEYYKNWYFRLLQKIMVKNKVYKIGILGLAYKPKTKSTKNSPSIELIKKIESKQIISVYDPLVLREDVQDIKKIKFEKSALDVLKKNDIIILSTEWNEFRNFSKIYLSKYLNNKVLIDPYGILKEKILYLKKIKYFSLI